jgi:hypothetical protein
MANLIRSAKPASVWNQNDLLSYNIQVVPETVATFFGSADLPPSTISPAILTHEVYPVAGLPSDGRMFFDFLKDVMAPPREESVVIDFAAMYLLGQLYEKRNRLTCSRIYLPLFMCSTDTHARPDVCLIDWPSSIPRLVLEAQRHLERKDGEPQLIADAIAAFQFGNSRLSAMGLPTVDVAVIPAIAMVGTAPTFYKVDINTTLVEAVERGEFPTDHNCTQTDTPCSNTFEPTTRWNATPRQ